MDLLKIHIVHEWQGQSRPYIQDVETALDDLKATGLQERGWDTSGEPGIIRHETGPEIFTFVVGAVEIIAAIIHLVGIIKRHHPETIINVSVADPTQIASVLESLRQVGGTVNVN